MSKMFGVLDADGDQEIVISELHRAMEGLQVRIRSLGPRV